MSLLLTHPEVAYRSCEDCKRWIYDDKTGERRNLRTGEPMERPRGVPTPCLRCPKCTGVRRPNPTDGSKATLSEKNMKTLALYYEHQAAPMLISDPIVRRNFGLIHRILAAYDRTQARLLIATVQRAGL